MVDNLIYSTSSGEEIGVIKFRDADFEVGQEDNSFLITMLRSEYTPFPAKGRIYLPGTEYGGIIGAVETNTAQDTIAVGGYTWRGMMTKKIIEPLPGDDYAKDSGELNEVISARVEAAFPGLFVGSGEDTGVSVSNFQYDRYTTLEAGLTKMLKSVGYRLNLSYRPAINSVIVSAVPIVDYSYDVVFSSDMRLNYQMKTQTIGVNHLICLGKGELKDREVYNLYVDNKGKISTTQYYFGVDEVAEVYDSGGSELPDLIQGGTDRLKELAPLKSFEIAIDSDMELAIGDIVGGKDYLSGMRMSAPITGKIVRWQGGFQTIEYKLADDITATEDSGELFSKAKILKAGLKKQPAIINSEETEGKKE